MKQNPRILVVDDERDIVETLEIALRHRGFDVRVAFDGSEALALAKSDPPDLMLLDVMMPGCNGYEVSRQLKQWMRSGVAGTRHFPILLVTARRLSSADREDFVATWSQADEVIYKPFALRGLIETVERHLLTADVASA